ncbi:MAG: branched-chain amino acid transport system permease protein, partial [Gaiellales bacterium]|nr:branched-chain amino acid transport system permease protein [Gaiellales bacterium]
MSGFRVKRWDRVSIAATSIVCGVVAALAFAPTVLGANGVDKLTTLLVYVILAVMWNALAGYAGLVSVGQQAFFGLGAYFTIQL